MTGLQGKRWYFFIWDEDNIEHLFAHGIEPEAAEQVFFNRYVITPNRRSMALGSTESKAGATRDEACA